MAEKNRSKIIGDNGERTARQLLINKGYRIIETNYRLPCGEIDIIAADNEYIAFVEVKTRNTAALDRPSTFVDKRKQKKLILTASQYLAEHETELQPRFDVIEVIYDRTTGVIVHTEHIENAFIQTEEYSAF